MRDQNRNKNVWKRRIVFSVGFSMVASLVVWLVLGDNSPFSTYFLYHGTVPNLLRQMLIIPYLALMIVQPSSPLGDDVVVYAIGFLQWFVVGYLLSLLLLKK